MTHISMQTILTHQLLRTINCL